MLTIQNASDVVKLLDIVNVFMTVRDSHKAELEAYLDKIDKLQREVCDKDVIVNGHICEINQMYGTMSDLEKEKQALTTLNSALSDEIERIKTQQSCDEAVVIRDTVIDNLREELRLTIEKNEMLERANGELQDKIETLR